MVCIRVARMYPFSWNESTVMDESVEKNKSIPSTQEGSTILP